MPAHHRSRRDFRTTLAEARQKTRLDGSAAADTRNVEMRKLARVDLGGLPHSASRLVYPHPPLSQVGLAPLKTRPKLRAQLRLRIEVIGQPILELEGSLARQLAQLGLQPPWLAHAATFSSAARFVKRAAALARASPARLMVPRLLQNFTRPASDSGAPPWRSHGFRGRGSSGHPRSAAVAGVTSPRNCFGNRRR